MEHLVKSLKALDLDGNTLVVQKQAYSSQSFGQSLCCLLSSHFFNTQKIIVNSALLLKTSSGKSLMVTAKVSTLPSKESKQLVFESVLLSSLVDIILDTKLCEAFDITENQKISITPISNEECLEIFAPALKVSIRLLSMKSNNGRDRFLAPITTFLCELQYIFSRQIYYMPGLDVQFEIISIKSASSGVLLSAKFSSKSKLGFEEGSNLQLAPSGLESQFDEIKQTIEFPLAKLSFFEMYQLRFPRGILLYGPPGTGKTMLARIVASSLNLYSIVVDGASLSNKYFGESEAYVQT